MPKMEGQPAVELPGDIQMPSLDALRAPAEDTLIRMYERVPLTDLAIALIDKQWGTISEALQSGAKIEAAELNFAHLYPNNPGLEVSIAPMLVLADQFNRLRGFSDTAIAETVSQHAEEERQKASVAEEPSHLIRREEPLAPLQPGEREALQERFQVRFGGPPRNYDRAGSNLDALDMVVASEGIGALIAQHHSGKSVLSFQLAERYAEQGGISCMTLGAVANSALTLGDAPAPQGERNGIAFSSARELREFVEATLRMAAEGPVKALLVIDEAGVVPSTPESRTLLSRFYEAGGNIVLVGHDRMASPHVVEHLQDWTAGIRRDESQSAYTALELSPVRSAPTGGVVVPDALVRRLGGERPIDLGTSSEFVNNPG